MKKHLGKRLLSLLLAMVIVLGLVPAVSTPKAEAATEAEIAAQTASLLADLKSRYGSLTIPKTKAKYVTTGNVGSLAGTYFMVIYGAHHRMINYGVDSGIHYDRLNGNCYNNPPKEGGDHGYFPSLHINIANWQTENGEFTGINGLSPENLLDYAVEFTPNTVPVDYNEWYADEGYVGWTAYTNYEYNRKNKASGSTTGFGPYMGVNGIMSKSDTAYNIRSLHPTRTSLGKPWVGTYDTWGNAGYRTSAMPIFIKPNTDGRTFKMYKVDFQNASNCYTYWFGVDESYDYSPITAHTISQIVREDRNLNTTTYPGHNPQKFATDWELFQISPLTLELYKALYEVKDYVLGENSNGDYPADAYLDFLQYASTAMTDYNNNRGTFNDSPSDPVRTVMDTTAQELRNRAARLKALAELSATEALKVGISGLRYPLAQTLGNVPGRDSSDFSGIYLIVSTYDNGQRKHTTLNPDGEESDSGIDYVGYAVEIPDQYSKDNIQHFWGKKRASYSILKGSPSDFTIQSIDGRYWNFEDISGSSYAGLRLRSDENGNRFTIGVASGRYHEIKKKSNNWYLYSNSWTYRAYKSQLNNNLEYFFFAKVCDELFYLRDALQNAVSYLIDNSSGRFDADDYANFLTIVENAYDFYYAEHGKLYDTITSATKTTASTYEDEIYAAIAKLKLSDNTQSYIDVPVEILDFRGDGFLFECSDAFGSPYSLSRTAYTTYGSSFSGNYVHTGTSWDNFQITGLVEDELVNGRVVYTKETVDFIAYHLSQKTHLKGITDKMNPVFYQMVNGGLPYDADGYAATIADTDTGAPGGKLDWEKVDTAHDLAYYLLSNMWVESKEKIGEDTYIDDTTAVVTYNMLVPELRRIRLFKSGNSYVYDGNSGHSTYDYGYIYNDSTTQALTNPCFQPLNGKGFESPERYGQKTEGSDDAIALDTNYHFTIHAYGGFVYTESSNLFFEFGGDDDVYFFINGQLICDMGGIHGMTSQKVYLNDLVERLGLRDGDLCRFDMFHAERHTTGINFALNTNIQLMDDSLITEKGQYDSSTQKPIMDGGAVNTGTAVGYEFSLLNRRGGPAENISFADSKIGVTLNGTSAVLNAESNRFVGAESDGLCITYSTYNAQTKTVVTGPVQTFSTLKDITELIGRAVVKDTDTPLEPGVYRYYLTSVDDLTELLALGIPASCKLTIRGFRYTISTAGQFTNTLTTSATPIEYKLDGDGVPEPYRLEPVTGTASCSVSAMTIDMVAVNDPYAVVLDYGKTVAMDLTKIAGTLTPSSGVQISYAGATFNGSHGTVRATKPANLTFTASGNHYTTDAGYYAMASDSVLRFTPKDIMNGANTFYAVYYVTAPSVSGFTPYYIMKEVSFLPATSVYYETDFTQENIYQFGRDNGLLINFGDKDPGNWKAQGNNMTGTKANGVLKGTITGTDPFIWMTQTAYSYVVKPGDVVKVRIKSAPSTGNGLQVFFTTNVNTNLSGTGEISTGVGTYFPNNEWQTITMPIWSKVYGQTVTAIRIDPIGNNNSFSSTGSYEIDWVYIGPDDAFNTPVVLSFDSDDTTQWSSSAVSSVKKEDGALKVTTTGASDPTVTMTTLNLKRVIQEDDVLMLRVKSPAGSGAGLQVFLLNDMNSGASETYATDWCSYTPNGEWQTLTMNLRSGLVGRQIIGLRLDPPDSPAASATFEYDWVYIGPRLTEEKEVFSFEDAGSQQGWTHLGSPSNTMQQAKLPDATTIYGYDSAYAAQTTYSGNSCYFVKGDDVPLMKYKTDENGEYILDAEGKKISYIAYEENKTYAEASFTFTGTGFDIIGRTGKDQGALRIVVCDAEGNVKKSASVINKGDTELYQVPVVSVEMRDNDTNELIHGTYTAHIFVNGPFESEEMPGLNRGNEFYFDAIRVYDTMDTTADTQSAKIANQAYQNHKEASPVYREVRNMLIDSNSFSEGYLLNGVVYLEGTTADGVTFPSEVGKYAAIGPNNEVYLSYSNSIAFKLEVDGPVPEKVAIGARSANGTKVNLYANVVTAKGGASVGEKNHSISTTTEMYYPIEIGSWTTDSATGKSYVYIRLMNSGTGILSVSNIRMSYGTTGKSKSVRFLVDTDTFDVFAVCPQHQRCYVDYGETHSVNCENCSYVIQEAHIYREVGTVVAPTCTEIGYTSFACEYCDSTYVTDELEALGHKSVADEAVAPTCTGNGLTAGEHCESCGEVLVAQRVLDALGHSHVVVVTAPTCTEDGFTTYTCTVCNDSYVADEVSALGHSYKVTVFAPTCVDRGCTIYRCDCGDAYAADLISSLGHDYRYVNNGEDHSVSCANGCDHNAVEAHDYVNGICVCGALELVDTEVDANLTFGAQLYLENDLTMAFRVKGSKLDAYDISTVYLVVEREVYESGATEAIVVSTTITDYTISADGRYVFSYPGIAAAQMNDAIRATLYIKDASGKEYVSPALETSVATYLDGLLSNSTSDTKLMTLILDMVNYGAAAQVYFDRHADAPVNEAFQSFKTYASYASADFTTVLEDLSGTTANEGATGKLNQGLDLGTRIGIQYKVTLPEGVSAEDATLVITDENGNKLETIDVSTGTVDSKGRYIVNFYGATSKDMRRVVYATAYANGTAITGTYAYSISTYAWGIQENASAMDENLVSVTRAMMLYGDSANVYFG